MAEIAEALPIRRRVYAPVDTLVHEELSRKALIMNSMHSLSMNHDAIFLSSQIRFKFVIPAQDTSSKRTPMGIANLIASVFGEDEGTLYRIFSLSTDLFTPSALKKSYHKQALKCHPDKLSQTLTAEERASATKRFQAITAAYDLLKDDERRSVYDECGEIVDDGEMFSGDENDTAAWTEYFDAIYQRVTTDLISKFENTYKGGDEEKADVMKWYVRCEGDVKKMVNCVMCSDECDIQRWVKDWILPAVQRGDVERYASLDKFLSKGGGVDMLVDGDSTDDDDDGEDLDDQKPNAKTKKKAKAKAKTKSKVKISKKAKEELQAKELMDMILNKNKGGSASTAVSKKQSSFNDLIDNIENKYGGKGREKKKLSSTKERTCLEPDIDDDEFERIRASLTQK